MRNHVTGPRKRRQTAQLSAMRSLLVSEAGGGLVLMAAAAAALVAANSIAAPHYFGLLELHLGPLSVLHWINDALMALFFLLVGLEIKRELLDGELSTMRRRLLPGIGAFGGMAVPASIYLAFNLGAGGAPRGWAIPSATDIAFALGVLALLGSRVPVSLKVFLTALAIIDDLGAIAIIAVFYSSDLFPAWLAAAGGAIAILVAMNRFGVARLAPYLAVGALLWVFVLLSGVHATLAGVALALCVPLRRSPGRPDDGLSPLHRLEHALQPWVGYAVVPIFGFANAGVALDFRPEVLLAPVTLGVAAGLFAGKQLGVFLAVWLAIRLKLAEAPDGATLLQLYGVALLCGIGFTMSLFIGLLAFDSEQLHAQVKLGVLCGSLLSALGGAAVLAFAPAKRRRS